MSTDWLEPSAEQHALQRYVTTLRERLPLILITTLLTTLAAVGYLVVANKVYSAEANMLVTPVGRDDETLSGLSILRDSSDPSRDVQTGAKLVTTRSVADRVKRDLGLEESVEKILERVEAQPVAQSNIVAVSATGDSPEQARDLANAFAASTVRDRTARLHSQLDGLIEELESRLRGRSEADTTSDTVTMRSQLARLQTLRAGQDPTIRVEARAARPESPSRPRPALTIAAGLIAGLILGVGGAFALQILDPRVRREEQLRSLYRLPILARIPVDLKRRRGFHGARPPEMLEPVTLEAYRSLRATLLASTGGYGASRSILVTSASPNEGKSTTAINLASALALVGHEVILIEADLRRPSVGDALGVETSHGTDGVLLGTVALREALVKAPAYGDSLRVLLAEEQGAAGAWMADQLFLPAAQQMIEEAKQMADFVVIDSPPLSEVMDALPLARHVEDVMLVVRFGKTQIPRLERVGEVLDQHDVRPSGFVVIGYPRGDGEGYYYQRGAEPTVSRRAGRQRRRDERKQEATR